VTTNGDSTNHILETKQNIVEHKLMKCCITRTQIVHWSTYSYIRHHNTLATEYVSSGFVQMTRLNEVPIYLLQAQTKAT